jgi:putative flippase GtrA
MDVAIRPGLLGRLKDNLLHPANSQTVEAQVVRQMASGTVATLTDIAGFKLGLVAGIEVLTAALLAMTLSSLVNFVITRLYVFGQIERQRKEWWAQLLMYVPAVLVSIALTRLILYALSVRGGFDPMLVKVFVAVPAVFFWTFLSGKLLIFDKRRD